VAFVLAAAVLAAGLGACSSSSGNIEFVRVSGRLPVISGATIAGGSLAPSDYAGKIVVVNFWNYDCPPCREETPVLQADWTKLRSRGVVVIGLMFTGSGWPDDLGRAKQYLRTYHVTYPTLVDAGALGSAAGIAGIPTTVIADRTGEMRYRILGKVRPGQVEQLIGELAGTGS
jgi:cytochrome c biogenesis protein CcmG/thiol:disulfide interchange protein DsbE